MPNVTVGSFSLGAGPLISGDCLGWLLIIRLLSHRPQSEATPRADPAKPAMERRKVYSGHICQLHFLHANFWIPEIIPRMSFKIGEAKKPPMKNKMQGFITLTHFKILMLSVSWRWFCKKMTVC